MKKIFSLKSIITSLILSLTIMTGLSQWVITANADFTAKSSTYKACAYIGGASTTRYYDIKDALDAAASSATSSNPKSVFVIPGVTTTITSDCTIASYVSLILPYSGEDYTNTGDGVRTDATWNHTKTPSLTHYGISDFSDSTAALVSANLKSSVTLATGKTMTINANGKLLIGGETGWCGQKIQAQTSGYYSQILMESNSSIINNGTIECYGYIKEGTSSNNGSSVIVNSGATIKEAFVIYDFQGGSCTAGLYRSGKVSPFSLFDMPNIQSLIRFNYGSTLTAIGDLYASNSFNTTTFSMIASSNAFFMPNSSSAYITIKYTTSVFGYTKNGYNSSTHESYGHTRIDFYGQNSVGSLSMSVSGVDVDMATVLFPISHRHEIHISSGTTSVSQKLKIMNGGKVVIETGAKAVCNGNIIVYSQDWSDKKATLCYNYLASDSGTQAITTSVFGTGKLIVNGELDLNNSFGGLIETTANTGKVISSSATLSVTSLEGTASLLSFSQSASITEAGRGYFATGNASETNFNTSTTYNSQGDYWQAGQAVVFKTLTISVGSGNTPTYTVTVSETQGGTGSQSSSPTSISIRQGYWFKFASGDNISSVTLDGNSYTSDTWVQMNDDHTIVVTPTPSSGCLIAGSKLLMSDGTYKNIESIASGDYLKTWSFEKGCYEDQVAIFNESSVLNNAKVIHLNFTSGAEIGILLRQGFFDVDSKEYFVVNKDNASSMVGRRVFSYGLNDSVTIDTICGATITTENVAYYEIVTAYNFNIISNGILSVGGVIVNSNFFDVDDNFKWDSEKMEKDIATYGLYTYEEFKKIIDIPEWLFDYYQAKYFKVAIGKGEFTIQDVINAIETYTKCLGLI
jgi:hypothetical protein